MANPRIIVYNENVPRITPELIPKSFNPDKNLSLIVSHPKLGKTSEGLSADDDLILLSGILLTS